ncbi:MAG: penicillin-binding transpeptidase domain-containing protein [Chloroflexota bacterium]
MINIKLTREKLFLRLVHWLLVLLIVVGCVPILPNTSEPTLTPTLSEPGVSTTRAPDAGAAARAYLEAWQADDYATMYGLLTSVSRDALSEEGFSTRYRQVAAQASLESLSYEILSVLTYPKRAQVAYRVTLHTILVGDITRETSMNLSLENGEWHVQWDDTLILPELAGGNYLSMYYEIPSRGNIYDRNGHAIVAQAEAVSIGIIPGQINPNQEETLLRELSLLTGIPQETLLNMIESYQPDWYLPIGEASSDKISARGNVLYGLSGLVLRPYRSRYYFNGGIASQVIGYISFIQAEEAEAFQRKGYRVDEKVGRIGLEKWGEAYLAGKRGGTLYVVSPEGQIITKLAESAPEPAYQIYTTLDMDLQLQAQTAIEGFLGSIIVLERDTGRILALVSSPGFDPNLFDPSNFNSSYLIGKLFEPPYPTFNRGTQGQYSLGSVFKIITMSAALESGLYTPSTTYNCGYFFTELQGLTLNDWTYDYFLEDGETSPSGVLTLVEGLMRSCNPYFWHIGLDLFRQGLTHAITDMAIAFGLNQATGIEQVAEAEGQILEPTNEVEAVNQAIGQGPLLVTPLQVVDFVAALGNGGTIYRPQVVERVESVNGEVILSFTPVVRGTLGVTEETLTTIQEAMKLVVDNPRGTAYHRFRGLNVPVAGKTGTATIDGFSEPHAWFVGYTYAEKEDKPDIAVVVLLENAGQGSDFAAPIFRRIVEIYFYGGPLTRYPWEAKIGMTKTPTPEVTETPSP